MKGLRRDDAGRPVPFFVEYVDGKPDFRIMNPTALKRCIREDLCWVCGDKLTKHHGKIVGVFVAGPMCLVNRTSAEPPSHHECAQWSARACPFLVNPNKVRRDGNMPDTKEVPGVMIPRNPGVTALIESLQWVPWDAGNGLLIEFRQIQAVGFMTEGRQSTTKEVMESIESGLPTLYDMAKKQDGAVGDLSRKLIVALGWVPDSRTVLNSGDYPVIEEVMNA
jgi:hypothetical protein